MEPNKRRIMLVDDEENILVTLGDFLAFQGSEVTLCRSGRDALKMLEQSRPELILLDIMMPGLDGGDVAQRIASDRRFAKVPIMRRFGNWAEILLNSVVSITAAISLPSTTACSASGSVGYRSMIGRKRNPPG